jgi:hypothetical protein
MLAPRPSLHLATLLAALALAGVALPAPARALVAVGVGDQKPAMFADSRFRALGIEYARLSVAWDALEDPRELRTTSAWLDAARADGVSPLVTFDRARGRRSRALPSPARFEREFRRFHEAYPEVSDYATWNEANYSGERTYRRPALVAAYYRRMRRVCPMCNILGAELLDVPNMVSWVRAFKHALHGEPEIWGLHNYVGANRLQTATTQELLAVTSASIWFTETGGVISRHNHSSTGFTMSAAHAAKVMRFLFERLAHLSTRIERLYIYQWDGGGPRASWDSGLIAPNGHARPGYAVFARELRAFDAAG